MIHGINRSAITDAIRSAQPTTKKILTTFLPASNNSRMRYIRVRAAKMVMASPYRAAFPGSP